MARRSIALTPWPCSGFACFIRCLLTSTMLRGRSRFRWRSRKAGNQGADGVRGLLARLSLLGSRIAAEADRRHDLPSGSTGGAEGDDRRRAERDLLRATVPSILRRARSGRRLARTRRPNPGTSSSKYVRSVMPAGHDEIADRFVGEAHRRKLLDSPGDILGTCACGRLCAPCRLVLGESGVNQGFPEAGVNIPFGLFPPFLIFVG